MTISSLVANDFLAFDADESVGAMLGQLKLSGRRSGLVFKDGNYNGIINRRSLLKSRLADVDVRLAKCTTKTPIISHNLGVLETAKLMHESNLRFLPVEIDGDIVGVVNALDLLREASGLEEVQSLRVGDLKLAKPSPLKEDDKLSRALSTMQKEKVDHLPIFSGRKLQGVISIRDLMDYFIYKRKRPSGSHTGGAVRSKAAAVDRVRVSSLPVISFATTEGIKTVHRDDSLVTAIKLMHKYNVRDLVVQENDRVYGLVTVKNILASLAGLQRADGVSLELVGLRKTSLLPSEVAKVEKAIQLEMKRFLRKKGGSARLKIHVKESKKKGSQHMFTVSMRLEGNGKVASSSQEDWDVVKAVRKCFSQVRSDVKRRK